MSSYKVREFHPAMILKKYKYCPNCGEKLVKEKHTRIVTKDDEDFYKYYCNARGRRGISFVVGDAEISVETSHYTCPACNKSYTYEQLRECVKANKK